MSIVAYNTVTLPYSLTTQFRQEAIADESDTDWYCARFDIMVQSLVHDSQLALLAPDLINSGVTNPAQIMRIVYSRLMERRKTLSMKFNDVELIPQNQTRNNGTLLAGRVDAQNGPKPQYCGITQLNNKTWLITYHIIAHYWENNSIASNGDITNRVSNDVLYNRWTESIDLDRLGMSRRVRDGKFILRSDNASGVSAMYLRQAMCMLGVPEGFLRDSSKYTISPDGLGMQYTVTDREVFKKPPAPAFEAEGNYYETLGTAGGIRHAEVFCRLKGAKTVNQSDMFRTCVGLCARKLELNGANFFGGSGSSSYLTAGMLGVDLYQNIVECRLRMFMPPALNRIQGIAAVNPAFCFTPGSDQNPIAPGTIAYTPPYQLGGSANLFMQAAAYWDPNLVNLSINPVTGQATDGLLPGEGGVGAPVRP